MEMEPSPSVSMEYHYFIESPPGRRGRGRRVQLEAKNATILLIFGRSSSCRRSKGYRENRAYIIVFHGNGASPAPFPWNTITYGIMRRHPNVRLMYSAPRKTVSRKTLHTHNASSLGSLGWRDHDPA